jgi:hypothetical protein
MYNILLATHNLLRWVVLILAVVSLARAYSGWLGARSWTARDRTLGVAFSSALDTQFLLGLILYIFFSPLTRAFFTNMGAAMQSAELRFYGIEHIFYMLAALVLVHIGSSRARKAGDDRGKFRQAAIWYSVAVLLILVGIPWGRPLLPGLG